MERLQKVIANSGYCSRRKAEELIQKGKVIVNDIKVTELGFKVNGSDKISIDGKMLSRDEKEYYLLYKPRGIITSTKDEKNRKTVVDLKEYILLVDLIMIHQELFFLQMMENLQIY